MNDLAQGDDIVNEFKKGNEKSLNSIFDQYYAALCYFAHKLILNKEEAEDIVVQTFMKLWAKHAHFDSLRAIRAFLYITTKNACINYLDVVKRSNRRHAELAYRAQENDDHILNNITRAEVLREIHLAIQSLPVQCGKVASMSLIDGMKNQEIARELDLSEQTVRNHKSRAIQVLRLKLIDSNIFFWIWLYSQLNDRN
jgi:RNA polymerase sigma-70 factor (family 1)